MIEVIWRLERLYPGFNQRPLTFEDLELCCEQEGVILLTWAIPWPGWFFQMEGVPVIAINKYLSSILKTYVGFHEFAHFLLHPADYHYYAQRGIKDKIEYQAHVVASLAVVPTPCLDQLMEEQGRVTEEDLIRLYDIPQWLAQKRIEYYKNWKLLTSGQF